MNDIDHKKLQKAMWAPTPVTCPTCSHTTFKTWHKLNRAHLRGLVKLADAVLRLKRPVDRYEAGIGSDGSEYGNFAAMRWWKLIESHEGNTWTLTPLGWDFLAGRKRVSERVLTLRGELIGVSPGLLDFRRLADNDTWKKADYLANRIPVTERDYSQGSLFSRLLTSNP